MVPKIDFNTFAHAHQINANVSGLSKRGGGANIIIQKHHSCHLLSKSTMCQEKNGMHNIAGHKGGLYRFPVKFSVNVQKIHMRVAIVTVNLVLSYTFWYGIYIILYIRHHETTGVYIGGGRG